jgi:hypothetical protein
MGHWQHTEKAKQAWDYLNKTIAPDIAPVQEAVPISEHMGFISLNTTNQESLIGTERINWQEIGGNRKWGSGILTKRTRYLKPPQCFLQKQNLGVVFRTL